MTGLLLLILGAAAGGAWWQFLKGRERARQVAGLACRELGLLLIDDTVVLEGISRDPAARFSLLGLNYRFDFAFEGRLHRGGRVWVTPSGRARVAIETRSGQVIQEF